MEKIGTIGNLIHGFVKHIPLCMFKYHLKLPSIGDGSPNKFYGEGGDCCLRLRACSYSSPHGGRSVLSTLIMVDRGE